MARARTQLTGAVRRMLEHSFLLPAIASLLRARTVHPSAQFLARELLHRRGVYTYRLARGGLLVPIRHGTADAVTLGEVFHDHDYVPSPKVEAVLDGVTEIVDLGANIGLFGAFAAARWPTAQIIAFEPDPANFAMHELTIGINGLEHRWQLVAAAAGVHDGEVRFLAGRETLSRIAEPSDEAGVTVLVRDVLELVGSADLVKMDIEGGEWAILGDPRFRRSPPRVVVLEYHPSGCPAGDPRATAERALRDAELTVVSGKHRDDGHGILWAWRV